MRVIIQSKAQQFTSYNVLTKIQSRKTVKHQTQFPLITRELLAYSNPLQPFHSIKWNAL